ncbi:hypothetical protein EWM64_g3402 [Hericium alpestre]|uniref:START domain-containing protein n=1 Tax=Hericium alpestre TaxID=135208 RepID=A0A4Z0A2D2_9AGAM|nr:hypothetical protein EWM64_g3402 [Hericium alpestre]
MGVIAGGGQNGAAKGTRSEPRETSSSIWGGFAPKFSSPLSKYFTFAVEQATATSEQAAAALGPAVGDAVPALSKPPMQHALEALCYVQSLYSRPTTEGWTLVNAKGFPIYRKLEPQVSSSTPVHRAEKVIEGISAEEIASVITSYDCRKKWDTSHESAHILQTFGGECHTAFAVTKGGFPFRDRGFYLATVIARGQRRSDADSATPSDGPCPLFVVSASFNPESVTDFDQAKYNPYTLPIGRMFVDAWVLETLDPYTPENYAIPSTRCMRVVAADYAGSVPVAVNSLNNTALAKTILAVEAYVKGMSPLPFTRLPTAGVLLLDKRTDDREVSDSWTLKRKDATRMLVQTRYIPEDQVYRSTMLLTPASPLSTPMPEQTTPKASLPDSSSSDSVNVECSRAPSLSVSASTGSTLSTPRHRRVSSGTVRARSPSNEVALRASSSAFTLKGEVRPRTDLLVAEIVVDSNVYTDGYDVKLRSRIHDSATPVPLFATQDGPLPEDSVLPLTYTVHTLPSSPLHSSSLTSDGPSRHLLRLMLPTGQQQISTLQDPLTGETRGPPPKPEWLLELQEKGAVLDVEVRPSKNVARKGKAAVTVDGHAVKVESEKEALTSLGRDELLDDRVSWMATLTRYASELEELPEELQTPIAVAEHLLDPAATSATTAASQGSKEAEEGSVSSESSQEPTSPRRGPAEHGSLAEDAPPPPSAYTRNFVELAAWADAFLDEHLRLPAPFAELWFLDARAVGFRQLVVPDEEEGQEGRMRFMAQLAAREGLWWWEDWAREV